MNEQQLQQQIVQLVQAAMQGNQQATQLIQQIMQAAQQGDLQATQIAQMIQQVAQQMLQQQVRAAKFGAKLNYIKKLRGECPIGYEMQYFKKGGSICKKCVQKQKKMEEGGKTPLNPVDAFKCGRKMKKKACGGPVKKVKKALEGTDLFPKKIHIPSSIDEMLKSQAPMHDNRTLLPNRSILPDKFYNPELNSEDIEDPNTSKELSNISKFFIPNKKEYPQQYLNKK